MNDKTAARRWFQPRFSLRSLVIFITAVAVYLGLLGLTKRFGVPDERNSGAFAPFIVYVTTHDGQDKDDPWTTRYFLWLCGPRWKLPVQTQRRGMFHFFPSLPDVKFFPADEV